MASAAVQPLRQQELERPAPPRTIPACEGASWFGIDPSTKRMALGWVRADGERGVVTRSFPVAADGERLGLIQGHAWECAQEAVELGGVPGFVLVEQPFGKQVPPVSYMVAGVIASAVWRFVNALAGWPFPQVPVEFVGPPAWKALALGPGFGTCSKKDPRGYAVSRWARECCGYQGSSDDEADALGIAVAASRMVGFRPRAA